MLIYFVFRLILFVLTLKSFLSMYAFFSMSVFFLNIFFMCIGFVILGFCNCVWVYVYSQAILNPWFWLFGCSVPYFVVRVLILLKLGFFYDSGLRGLIRLNWLILQSFDIYMVRYSCSYCFVDGIIHEIWIALYFKIAW